MTMVNCLATTAATRLLLLLLVLQQEAQLAGAKKIWSNEDAPVPDGGLARDTDPSEWHCPVFKVLSCSEVVEGRREPGGNWTGLTGNLTSPEYPRPYPPRLLCRVDLKAPRGHRVKLVFHTFHLFHPLNLSNDNCNAMDSLTVQEWGGGRLGRYCGPGLPPPLMSAGPHLTLMFRSLTSGPHVKGYRATYTFLSDFGLRSGVQVEEELCTFEFNSSLALRGQVYSPNPGGLYPRNTTCHYLFLGQPGQWVRLNFTYFDVEGVAPCNAQSDSDYVEFSNLGDGDNMIPRRCGRFAPKVVESDVPEFRMSFISNHKYDGRGFGVEYEFVRWTEEDDKARVLRPRSFSSSAGVIGVIAATRQPILNLVTSVISLSQLTHLLVKPS